MHTKRCRITSLYRGHIIIMLVDERLSAEITGCCSGMPFPIKVSASMMEALLMERAHEPIDISLRQRNPHVPSLERRVA